MPYLGIRVYYYIKKNLVAIEIKVYLVAVKINLINSSTKIVIEVVILITSTIKIIKELIVFIGYKASKLEVFKITITVTKRVKKSIKIVGQQ